MVIRQLKAASGRQHHRGCTAPTASLRCREVLRAQWAQCPLAPTRRSYLQPYPQHQRSARSSSRQSDVLSWRRSPSSRSDATAIVVNAVPIGGSANSSGAASTSAPLDLPLPRLPASFQQPSLHQHHLQKLPAILQPLLAAVLTATSGRLASLPLPLLVWLLRVLAATDLPYSTSPKPSLQHPSSSTTTATAWLQEAYGSLLTRMQELTTTQAAQAYLAITNLLVRAADCQCQTNTSSGPLQLPPQPPLVLPQAELLQGLHAKLAHCGDYPNVDDRLDPRVALACLEAAATLESPLGPLRFRPRSSRVEDSENGRRRVPNELRAPSRSSQSQQQQQYDSRSHFVVHPVVQQQLLCMPQSTVEALLWRSVGMRVPQPHAPAASQASDDAAVNAAAAAAAAAVESLDVVLLPPPGAAAAAARCLVAAAHLANPPSSALIAALAARVAADGNGSGGTPGSGAAVPSPLLVDSLLALCALQVPPLPTATAAELLRTIETNLGSMDALQLSYSVTAVQRLVPRDMSAAVVSFARGTAATALARSLPDLSASRLAAAIAALPPPLLRPPPAAVAEAAHAVLRGCLAAADSDDLAEVVRQLDAADVLPSYGWQTALAAAMSERLQDPVAADAVPSQELSNTLFLLAILNYRPSYSWTSTAAAALQPRLLTLTATQLTNAFWALAKFGYRVEGAASPSTWSVSAVQAVQLQLPSLQPHQLSYCLGSLQRLGCYVSSAVLDEMLAAAAEQMSYYPPSDLVLLLITVCRLRHVPSYSFTEAVTERLRPHLLAASAAEADKDAVGDSAVRREAVGDVTESVAPTPPSELIISPLTCQELASVAYALAKLHSRPESEWMRVFMSTCEARLAHFSADLLATLLWAVGELGQVPSPAWLSAFLSASRSRLSDFAPPDLVSVLSSLAALRCAPPAEWLAEALTLLGARVGGLDGEGVTALLKALVDLDARVSNSQWYDALCDQVYGYLPLLPPRCLAELLTSLAALGHTPQPPWLARCAQQVAARSLMLPRREQQQQQQEREREQQERGTRGRRPVGREGDAGQQVGGGAAGQQGEAAAVRLGSAGDGDGDGGGGAAAAAETVLGSNSSSSAGGYGGGGYGSSGGYGSISGGLLSEGQLEACVCGLVQMGAAELPPQLLQAFFSVTLPSLGGASPQRITSLVSALAGAKPPIAPEPTWLNEVVHAVRSNLQSYTLVQLDAITRALAVFVGLVPEHEAARNLLAYLREFCLYG